MGNKNLLASAILVIALCFASAAAAQDSPNFVAARAMIDGAGLGDVFEPVEDENVSVRHRASGLVCRFYGNETRTQLAVFESGLPRGEDVGCVSDRPDSATTIYATRYAPQRSAEDALAEAVAAIRHRFPDAQETPAELSFQSEGLPRSHVANFLVQIRGERWLTNATVAQSGDWIIKLRYSVRAVEDDALLRAQLEAGALFAVTMLRMQGSD